MSALACRINTLAHLGIPYWIKRPDSEGIHLQHPKFQAKLCVLLSHPILSSDVESNKILQGMLKVLNCANNELYLSWITKSFLASFNLEKIMQVLERYRSENIFLLGNPLREAFEQSAIQKKCWITYHPDELLKAPQLKKEAYQVLLSLKDHLNKTKEVV